MKESFDGLLLGSSSGGEPGGARAAKPRGVDLARKFISCAMAVVMAVSLMPLPAYAQGSSGYAAVGLEAGTLADDGDDATADEPGEAFSAAQEVDGVTVRVDAEEGAFAAGAKTLSVAKAALTEAQEEAVSAERGERNVAASYTFDIKVLDQNGNELQPAEGKKVDVSFAAPEAATSNLEGAIYHHVATDSGKAEAAADAPQAAAAGEGAEGDDANGEADDDEADPAGAVEALDTNAVTVEGQAAVTAETDGFSLYTVEFTYGDLQYVMAGDTTVALADILAKVGLTGEVEGATSDAPELFSVGKEDGEWAVTANKAFQTEQKLTVRIDGVDYEIKVTDAVTGSITVSNATDSSFTISFDNNSAWFPGASGTMTNMNLAAQSSQTLPACTFTAPSGYTFAGWSPVAFNADNTGYRQIYSDEGNKNLNVTADTTLYAVWDKTESGCTNVFTSAKYGNMLITGLVDDGAGGWTINGWSDRTDAPTKIYIPATWLGKPITGIGNNGFKKGNNPMLEQVVFASDSRLTSIGDNAFEGELENKSVKLPTTLTTIGQYALMNLTVSNLADLVNVESVGQYAFRDYRGGTVDLSKWTKLTEYPRGMFSTYLDSNNSYSLKLNPNTTRINYGAFEKINGVVTIPATCTEIVAGSFYYAVKGTWVDLSQVTDYDLVDSWSSAASAPTANGQQGIQGQLFTRAFDQNANVNYIFPQAYYENDSYFAARPGTSKPLGLKTAELQNKINTLSNKFSLNKTFATGMLTLPTEINGLPVTELPPLLLGRPSARSVVTGTTFPADLNVEYVPTRFWYENNISEGIVWNGNIKILCQDFCNQPTAPSVGLDNFTLPENLEKIAYGAFSWVYRATVGPTELHIPTSVTYIGDLSLQIPKLEKIYIGNEAETGVTEMVNRPFGVEASYDADVYIQSVEEIQSRSGVEPWASAPWNNPYITIHWKDADTPAKIKYVTMPDGNVFTFDEDATNPGTGSIRTYVGKDVNQDGVFESIYNPTDSSNPVDLTLQGTVYEYPAYFTNRASAASYTATSTGDYFLSDRTYSLGARYWNTVTVKADFPLRTTANSAQGFNQFAFGGNSRFEKLVLGEGITKLQNYFLGSAINVKQVQLPKSLTSIGTGAFQGCTNLTLVGTLPPNLTSIGQNAFQNCPKLGAQQKLKTVSGAEKTAALANGTHNVLVIPNSVTTLSQNSFSGTTINAAQGVEEVRITRYKANDTAAPADGIKAPTSFNSLVSPYTFLEAPEVPVELVGYRPIKTLGDANSQHVYLLVRAERGGGAGYTMYAGGNHVYPQEFTQQSGVVNYQLDISSAPEGYSAGEYLKSDGAAVTEAFDSFKYSYTVIEVSEDHEYSVLVDIQDASGTIIDPKTQVVKADVPYGALTYHDNGASSGDLPEPAENRLIAGTMVTIVSPSDPNNDGDESDGLKSIGYKDPVKWINNVDKSATGVINYGPTETSSGRNTYTIQKDVELHLYPLWDPDPTQTVKVTYTAPTHSKIYKNDETTSLQSKIEVDIPASTELDPVSTGLPDKVTVVPDNGYYTTGWFGGSIAGNHPSESATITAAQVKSTLYVSGQSYVATEVVANATSKPYIIAYSAGAAEGQTGFGGSAPASKSTRVDAAKYKLANCSWTWADHAFVAWYLEDDLDADGAPKAGAKAYAVGQEVQNLTMAESYTDPAISDVPVVTLVAVWRPAVEAVITTTDKTVTYNGAEQSNTSCDIGVLVGGIRYELGSLPDGVKATVSVDGVAGASRAVKGTNAGSYTATVTVHLELEGDAADDYQVKQADTEATMRLVIEKAPLSVAGPTLSKQYGDDEATLDKTCHISGTFNDDKIIIASDRAKVDGAYPEDPGTYTLIPATQDFEHENYYIPAMGAVSNGSLTITKRVVKLKVKDKKITYMDERPEDADWGIEVVSGSSLAFSDTTASLLNDAYYISCDYVMGNPKGKYIITLNPITNKKYEIAGLPGILEVEQGSPTELGLIVTGSTSTYDGKEHTITTELTVSTDTVLTYSRDYEPADTTTTPPTAETPGTWKADKPTFVDAGTYDVWVKAYNPNYGTTDPVKGTVVIEKKAVTITAKSYSRTYGEDDPELGVKIEGAVAGEELAYTVERESGNDVKYAADGSVDTYAITVTPTAGKNTNYTVTTVPGTFKIKPKPITLTISDGTKVYGDADPDFSKYADFAGLEYDDQASHLSYKVKRTAGENAGTYDIDATVDAQATGKKNGNYKVKVVKGKFTITKKTAIVRAVDAEKIYGEADPTSFTWESDDILAEDKSDFEAKVTRRAGDNAGEYAMTVKVAAASDTNMNGNYAVTTENGVFTIKQRPVTLTVDPGQEKTYGEGDPTLTAKASAFDSAAKTGLVSGDTLVYTVEREKGENADAYKMSIALGANPNYAVETVTTDATGADIKFTIKKKAITITPKEASITYGDAEPELTATVSGVVGGDAVEYTVTREDSDVKDVKRDPATGAVVGYEMSVTFEADKNPNYDITPVAGKKFTINPKPITAKAVDATKVYGTADPEFTASFTGLVYPDTKADIDFTVSRENAKALANNQVGDYVLKVTTPAIADVAAGKHNGNYIVQPEDGAFTVAPKPVTVKAENKTQVYGASAKELTVKVDEGLVSGEIDGVTYADTDVTTLFPVKTEANPSGVIELSREAGDDVGTYVITAIGPAVIDNYAVTYQGGAYTIIKIDDKTLGLNVGDDDSNAYVYDASSHAIDAAVAVNEGTTIYYSTDYADKADDEKSTATWTTIPPSRKDVGTTKVTVKAVNPNYEDLAGNTVTIDLTVNPRPATVTAESFTITYGDADPELTATESGFLKNLDEYSASYTLSRDKGDDPDDPDGKNAGTYATKAEPGDGAVAVEGADNTYDQGNYRVTYVDGTLTIEKKAATVTADDKTKVYGDADPELTATVEGLVDGDPAEAIEYKLSRANGDDAGEYVITVAATKDAINYEVTFVNGAFTIEKKAITVKAADADKTYGEADPAFDLVRNDDGAIVDPDTDLTVLVGEDTLDYSVNRESGENAGTYAITVTLGENPNYDVTAQDGAFTINKKAITVKAEDAEKTYGEEDPAFDLVKNDDGAIVDPDTGEAVLVGDDVLDYSMARESGENAGVYAITANLGDNPNYDVTAQDGDFTINPKGVVITALDAFKVYGDADPDWADLEARTTVRGTLGDKYLSFLRDGDTTYVSVPVPGSANKYDEFTYTVSREEGEDVHDADGNIAEYAITPAGEEVQGNYKLDFVPATFTISPRDVTVTADDKSKVYGEDDPEFTAVVTGLVNDESDELITYELSRAEGENVGDYAITPAGDELQGNYRVSYADGTLTIVQKAITVMADDKTKVYGEADPAFTATVDGLVRGDGPEVLAFTLMRAAGEDVGTYAITAAGEESQGNYLVSYAPGTFTITKAAAAGLGLVGGYEGVYDAHTHTVAASVSVYDGTTIYYKDGDSNWTQNAPKIATVGSRDVLVRAENRNYETSQITMTLTVTPAPVVVTAEAKSKVYGDADPELTATVLGLIDNADIVYALTRANGENAGTYTITPAGDALQGNYKVTYLTSTLTVEQKEVGLVWADNLAYDGDEQDYEGATLTGLLSGDNVAVVYGGAMTGTDAGKYLASAQALVGTAALNYKLPANAAHTWKIAQADNSWMEKVAIAAWTAGKKPTAAQGEAEFGDVKFEFKKKGAKKSTYTTKKPTAPGTYIMRATVAGTKNYEGLVKTVKFTVKAPPMLLKSKSSKVTSSSIAMSWAKVPGAYRYAVYAAKCNKRATGGVLAAYKLSRLGTTVKTNYKATKLFNGTKLQPGTYYRLQVRALNKAGKVLAKSKVVYVTTKGGTTTNAKSVKVTSPSKGKLSLSVGASKWIKAKVKGKKLRKLAQIGFASSDPTVATVNRYGSVTGKKPGTCKIYVSAQNGVRKAVKVTVK